MHVSKDFKNELLDRREVEIIVEREHNPGLEGAKKAIMEKFGAGEDLVAVKKLFSKFGKKEFIIDAFIYHSKEAKEKTEVKEKIKGKKEEKPAEAQGEKK